jgi:hypothetical protein
MVTRIKLFLLVTSLAEYDEIATLSTKITHKNYVTTISFNRVNILANRSVIT